MKRLLFICSLLLLSTSAQAQLLDNVTAKELLPAVKSAAENGFAQDALLTHCLFLGVEYQGIRLEMDLQNGKATGWLYRYYSPSLDSTVFYIGVKVPIVGVQTLKLPIDTLTQYFPVTIGTTGMVEPWVDSDEALQGSKDGGADTFLQANQDAQVALAFTINNPIQNRYIPQGQYWLLRYTASADTLTCMVDAGTGQPFVCLSGNAPQILSIPPTTARVGVQYTYQVKAFGEPAPLYALTTAPAGMTIDGVTGAIAWTPAAGQEGPHDVVIMASNISGTDDQSYTITVQGAATGPRITSTPITEAVAGKQYVYQLASTGTPPPAYALAEHPTGMLIDGGRGSVFWTPTRAQAAAHQVRITATNSGGSDEQSYTLEVYSSPVISPIAKQRIAPDKEFQLQVSTDARPAPTYTLNAGPAGLGIDVSTGLIMWTPSAAQTGTHVVLFEASNRAGKAQQSFEIEVDATVGVSPLQQPGGFAILSQYPQPARDLLTLQLQSRAVQTLKLEVFDILGRLVHQQTQMYAAGGSQLQVPVQQLKSGLYSYRLSGEEQTIVRSFIVAH